MLSNCGDMPRFAYYLPIPFYSLPVSPLSFHYLQSFPILPDFPLPLKNTFVSSQKHFCLLSKTHLTAGRHHRRATRCIVKTAPSHHQTGSATPSWAPRRILMGAQPPFRYNFSDISSYWYIPFTGIT